MNDYLGETALLDYKHVKIQRLVDVRGWRQKDERGKILNIYNFVRDEIVFGFNSQDALPASKILCDGYGQCNTKSILFMALLRSVGITCRLHGFTVDSALQKGALTGIWYTLRPDELIHTWVEVLYKDSWLNIEGFILDIGYLSSVQKNNKDCVGSFCGFGIAVSSIENPPVYWDENDTYIQKEGIRQDFGVFDTPDAFFAEHRQPLNFLKRIIYSYFARHVMNSNIRRMRQNKKIIRFKT